jgi:metacaspase-1
MPSQYSTEGKIKEPNLVMEAGQGLLSAASSYARGDVGGVMQSVTGFVRAATTGRSAQAKSRQTKTSPADVVRMRLILYFR